MKTALNWVRRVWIKHRMERKGARRFSDARCCPGYTNHSRRTKACMLRTLFSKSTFGWPVLWTVEKRHAHCLNCCINLMELYATRREKSVNSMIPEVGPRISNKYCFNSTSATSNPHDSWQNSFSRRKTATLFHISIRQQKCRKYPIFTKSIMRSDFFLIKFFVLVLI